MLRIRRKPMVLEAWQWYPGVVCPARVKVFYDKDGMVSHGQLHTMEGEMRVRPGSYIVQGVAGEFYPVDETVFHLIYDIISED